MDISHERGGGGSQRQRQRQTTTDPIINTSAFQIPKLSPLENLPTELIQKIFFECLEINLPRSSLPIAAALSNEAIYAWLVRLAFSSDNEGSRMEFFTHAFLPFDYYSLSSIERADLQTAILECRWCTLPLMRKCQKQYMEHAIQQKCSDLEFSEKDRARLEGLETLCNEVEHADHAPNGRRGKGDLIIAASKPNPSAGVGSKIDVKLALWFHFGAIQIREHSPVYYETDVFRLPCCSLTEPCRIPDKLLSPPWTPEKLEFLSLLSTEAYVDEDSSHNRSKKVLRQVIKDREFEAFEKLLGMYIRVKVYRYPLRWPTKANHFRAALRWADAERDPFVETLLVQRWQDLPKDQVSLRSKMMKHVQKTESTNPTAAAGEAA